MSHIDPSQHHPEPGVAGAVVEDGRCALEKQANAVVASLNLIVVDDAAAVKRGKRNTDPGIAGNDLAVVHDVSAITKCDAGATDPNVDRTVVGHRAATVEQNASKPVASLDGPVVDDRVAILTEDSEPAAGDGAVIGDRVAIAHRDADEGGRISDGAVVDDGVAVGDADAAVRAGHAAIVGDDVTIGQADAE